MEGTGMSSHNKTTQSFPSTQRKKKLHRIEIRKLLVAEKQLSLSPNRSYQSAKAHISKQFFNRLGNTKLRHKTHTQNNITPSKHHHRNIEINLNTTMEQGTRIHSKL